MTDIKEIALRVAKESPWYYDNEPVGDSDAIDFAHRLIAAYLAEQEPVGEVIGFFEDNKMPRVSWFDAYPNKGTKLFTAPPEPAPQQDITLPRWMPKQEPVCAAPSSDEVQWRNIKHVVRTLADWAFGGKDDPRWGTAWVAMVSGLTAKDGPTFNLERLAARVPDGCVVVPREPTEAMIGNEWNRDMLTGIWKAMIAAGEVNP